MKFSRSFSNLAAFAGLALVYGLAPMANACTACMGDPNTRSAGAINGAIFLMLGIVFAMLGSIVAFIIHLARKAKNPLPPHAELAQDLAGQPNA